MELKAAFRKAVVAGLAAVTMSGAAYADEFGSNVRVIDEGQPVSTQDASAQQQQFPWSKDPRYIDQMQRAQTVYDANMHRLEVTRNNEITKCNTNSINAGSRQTNSGIASHRKNNPLGEIGAILGGVSTVSNNVQCQANVDSNFVRNKAQLETNFLRQEDSINRSFEQQYRNKAKQQGSRFVGGAQQKAPQSFEEKKQQACEQAELNAIKTGRDMNAVQKKMCTDILKR